MKAQTEANKLSDDADPLRGIENEMETDEGTAKEKPAAARAKKEKDDVSKTNDLIKKGIVKPVQLNSDVTILPSNKVFKRSYTFLTKTIKFTMLQKCSFLNITFCDSCVLKVVKNVVFSLFVELFSD